MKTVQIKAICTTSIKMLTDVISHSYETEFPTISDAIEYLNKVQELAAADFKVVRDSALKLRVMVGNATLVYEVSRPDKFTWHGGDIKLIVD